MSKHTPGPWEQYPILSGSENDKGFRVWAHDGIDGKTWIADVSPVIDNERGDASEMGKANARLIVAAPDLLKAAKHLATCGYCANDDPSACGSGGREALAAIAKAEGQ